MRKVVNMKSSHYAVNHVVVIEPGAARTAIFESPRDRVGRGGRCNLPRISQRPGARPRRASAPSCSQSRNLGSVLCWTVAPACRIADGRGSPQLFQHVADFTLELVDAAEDE